MGGMTKRKTRMDEIVILGRRHPGPYPTEIKDRISKGKNLTPAQEALIRDEVIRFVIAEGADFSPPEFVVQGLTLDGWMQVRQPVEYADYDYTEVEPSTVLPEPDEDEAVQEAVEAQAEAVEKEQDAEAKPTRRRKATS